MTTDQIDAIRLIQSGLDKLGHSPGTIDGQWGVRTARALRQLVAANGRPTSVSPQGPLPWITEAKMALGRNEARDRSWLIDWLKRDGRSLGDPAKNPWCGDFVETCIRMGLPRGTAARRAGHQSLLGPQLAAVRASGAAHHRRGADLQTRFRRPCRLCHRPGRHGLLRPRRQPVRRRHHRPHRQVPPPPRALARNLPAPPAASANDETGRIPLNHQRNLNWRSTC